MVINICCYYDLKLPKEATTQELSCLVKLFIFHVQVSEHLILSVVGYPLSWRLYLLNSEHTSVFIAKIAGYQS